MAPQYAETFDRWAASQMATMSLKIERCQAQEHAIRQRIVSRAEVTWEEDRRLEATLLGEKLAKHPERVSARLRETLHGCSWLLNRWAMLAYSAQTHGSWTPEQASLAFDLLGTPREFREGNQPGTEINFEGQVVATAEDQAAVARQQVAELLELKERLIPLDLAERERTQAGQADHSDAELRNLRRYEASLQRRLEWSMNLLLMLSRSSQATSEPEPEAQAAPIANVLDDGFDKPGGRATAERAAFASRQEADEGRVPPRGSPAQARKTPGLSKSAPTHGGALALGEGFRLPHAHW